MKLLFRCDASFEIGSGHVVRCMALASKLREQGHETEFACLPLKGDQVQWIKSQGIKTLHPDQITAGYDWCIVDHYGLSDQDETILRKFAKKIAVIDDWGTRNHDADLIIDPSISSDTELRRLKNPEIPFNSGSDWTLLRDDFSKNHPLVKPRKTFKDILVFFGGTDPADQTISYLNYISNNPSLLEFHFLIGNQHPKFEEIKKLSLPKNIHLYFSPPSISELMSKMDLYLGSSGTISWERMCMGLTGIIISVIDNQEDIAKTLHRYNLHSYLGKHNDVTAAQAFKFLENAVKDPSKLMEMSKKSYEMIDGNGALRFVKLLEKLS